jgi:hypothetical protein
MTQPKLKPCPFCGGKAKLLPIHNLCAETFGWLVKCNPKVITDSCVTLRGDTRKQAINAWNRRAKIGFENNHIKAEEV